MLLVLCFFVVCFFFFNDTATTEIYTLSLHDALPIYTTKQGLSNNSIQTLLVDNSGNVWFGTHNGLSKYNGSTFRTYTTEDGLSGNDITSLYEDKDGNLWAGTYGNGINKFSGDIWTTYTKNNGLVSDFVYDIKESEDGRIWIATNEGISSFDGFTFAAYDTSNGLVSNNISCIYSDKTGNLWFGSWGEGISKYDGNTFKTISVISGLSDLFVRNITEDAEGNIWIGTEHGLNKIEFGSQESVDRVFYKIDGLADDKVESLAFDSAGNLWIGGEKGLSKFNGIDWTNYEVVPDKSGPIGHKIYSLLNDSSGLWIGTEAGLTKYDSSGNWTNWTEKNGLSKNYISSIAKEGGNLWIGTMGGGIMETISLTSDTANVQIYNRSNSGLLSNYITSINIAPDGTKWFGTWLGGVTEYNGIQWTTYTKSNGLAGENVYSIAFESSGVSWFGTEGGLSRYDSTIWTNYSIDNGLPVNKVTALAVDSLNNKWIGTWGGGLVKYDDSTFVTYTKANGLADNYINQVNFDTAGNIWAATNSGISVFDGTNWQKIDEKVGLSENIVYTLLPSSVSGWIGSYAGLISGLKAGEVELKKEIPLDILADMNLETSLDPITTPGKLFLKARLNTSYGQLMAEDITPFYVVSPEQHVLLNISPDKEAYRPGDPIIISGNVTNLKDYDLPEVQLLITKGETGETVYSENFPLLVSETHFFSFNLIANSSFTLEASAAASPSVIINTKIIVAEPEIKVELIAPDLVSRTPFAVFLKLENIGEIDANMVCDFAGTIDNISLPKGKTILLTRELTTDKNISVFADISGDLDLNIYKNVIFGENAETIVTSQNEYNEGQIKIPYTINNNGLVDSELITDFKLVTSQQSPVTSENKTYFIPKGQSISNSLQYNLAKGDYKLSYNNYFDSGEVIFKVLKYNDLDINAVSDSNTPDGKINLSVDISNSGNNDFNGILLVESSFSRNEESLIINKGNSGNYNFVLTPVNVLPGQADIKVSVLYSGNVLLEEIVKADIYAPTFEFTSIPQ